MLTELTLYHVSMLPLITVCAWVLCWLCLSATYAMLGADHDAAHLIEALRQENQALLLENRRLRTGRRRPICE